jgi:putative endopeptidase
MKTRSKTRSRSKNKSRKKPLFRETYETVGLYKEDNRQPKQIDNKKIGDVLDTKIKHLLSMFKDESLLNKSPKTDFHEVTNITWMNKMNKSKEKNYFTQFDNYRVTQDKVYYHLIRHVKDYLHHEKKGPNKKICASLGPLLQSWESLDSTSIEQHIQQCVGIIDMYRQKKSNLWGFLAELNKNEFISYSLPLRWMYVEDKKNVTQFANYIISPTMGLFNIDIYFFPEHYPREKNRYLQYISRLFDTCFGTKRHNLDAQDVFDIECEIIMSFGEEEKDEKGKSQDEKNYNKIMTLSSQRKYAFDWISFSRELGYKHPPAFYITNNLSYLANISKKLVDHWDNEQWRTYWIFIHLNQMVRFHDQHRQLHYEFYEKELFGQNAIFPREIFPIFGLSVAFHQLLTNLYRKHHYREDYVLHAQKMANNLREIFIKRLEKNKWLHAKTKAYAILKVRHINLQIDYDKDNNNTIADAILQYDQHDVWGNMQKVFRFRCQQLIRQQKIVEYSQVDWKLFQLNGTQTYVVNAFYIPTFNRIFIPLAYLQPPFIDLSDRGIEYNLANLGFVLAHEFSHSLDIVGCNYDLHGNLKNWWTKEDQHRYQLKMQDVNKQYEKFMSYNGLKSNVSLYLGENIADITGLAICVDYLLLYHSIKDNLESVSTTFLSLKMFFNYYAIQMRQHLSDHTMELMLKTNPHPPDKYRINCPLARLQMFNKIFGITPADKMYWNVKYQIW